jgi:hypothetical protein
MNDHFNKDRIEGFKRYSMNPCVFIPPDIDIKDIQSGHNFFFYSNGWKDAEHTQQNKIDELTRILKDLLTTTENKDTRVEEMRGTIEAVLNEN